MKALKDKHSLLLLLLLASFVLDLATPLHMPVWLLYLTPIGLSYWLPAPWAPFAVAGTATVMVVAGFILSPPGAPAASAAFERTLGLLTVWLLALFLVNRKQAEEHLKEQALQHELIFNTMPIALYRASVSDDLPRAWVSSNMQKVSGFPAERFVSDPQFWAARLHPEDRDRVFAAFEAITETGSTRTEYRWRHADGTYHWFLDWATLSTNQSGQAQKFTGAWVDITERKQAEGALRESEAFKDQILESSPDCIKVLDLEGRLQLMNRSGQERLKIVEIAPFLGGQWLEFWKGGDKERARAALEAARTGNVGRFTGLCPTTTGEPKWWEVFITPLFDANGKPEKLLSISRDITERKQQEQVIRKSRDYYLKLLDEFPSPIWKSGLDATCDYFNKSWLAFTGRTMEQELGDGWAEGVHPEDRDRCVATYLAAFRAREPFEMEYRLRRYDDDYRSIIDIGHPYYDLDNNFAGYIGSAYDITERKQAEEVLQEARNEREQLMQNLHDGLIQSLYVIGMSMEECQRLAEEESGKAALKLEQLRSDINHAIREVRNHLVQGDNNLLFSATQFTAELTRVARTMERTNALHFRLKVDSRAAECLTTEERRELLYIAQETMSNCLRHSGASIASVSLRLERNRVRLEVEDDGMGFDRTTDNATSGGLCSIERRAAKIRAKIEIVSRREHGTRIRLDVPIHT